MASGLRTPLLASMLVAAQGDEEAMLVQTEEHFFERYSIVFYVAVWYLSRIGFEVFNTEVLIACPNPWAVVLWQQAIAVFIVVPRWCFGIRPTPMLTRQHAIKLLPASVFNLMTHAGYVWASSSSVSFAHIVKSSEPVLTSLLNFFITGQVFKWRVYLCLLPIIGGVVLASATELSCNWFCIGMAMFSTLGSASRCVYSKKVMSERSIGENMDPMNVFAVVTVMSTVLLFPISLAIGGPSDIVKGFVVAHAAGGHTFLIPLLGSGVCYSMYNEVAFLALAKLNPVSHAVTNTMLRVVIVATSFTFEGATTPLGVLGCCMAMSGTLLYSLCKG